MIDLHMHTNYSDGADDLVTILKKAEESKLEVISITDHDTCAVYDELKKIDIKKHYSGEIIKGVEMTTSFKGVRIELLGYGFNNHEKITSYFKEFHTEEHWSGVVFRLRSELIKKFDDLELKYDESILDLIEKAQNFETLIYDSLLESNHNLKEKLKEEYCESGYRFYRKRVQNPESYFCMNYAEYNPKIENIIKLIHDNGGKVFLAHPFLYGIKEIEAFIVQLCLLGLDGIECFHYDPKEEEMNLLLDYAKKNNILASGGSDYHGDERAGISLGVGRGNLKIPKTIIDNWQLKKDKVFWLEYIM